MLSEESREGRVGDLEGELKRGKFKACCFDADIPFVACDRRFIKRESSQPRCCLVLWCQSCVQQKAPGLLQGP